MTGDNCTELASWTADQAGLACDDLLTPSQSLPEDNDVRSLSKAFQRTSPTYLDPVAPNSGPHSDRTYSCPGVPSKSHMLGGQGIIED